MHALGMFLIYIVPFLILGVAAKRFMQRHGVDLADVHDQAGTRRRPRKVFLLGSWRTER